MCTNFELVKKFKKKYYEDTSNFFNSGTFNFQ
jgi:hypothetical protein